jgi:hypothetical protein
MPNARSKAILTISALLGAVELARTVSDQTLSYEVLDSTREVLKQLVSRDAHAKYGRKDADEKRTQSVESGIRVGGRLRLIWVETGVPGPQEVPLMRSAGVQRENVLGAIKRVG